MLPIKTVFISPHPTKVGVRPVLVQVLEILAQYQVQALLPHDMTHLSDDPAIGWVCAVEGVSRADVIITLGGDGTLLRMAGMCAAASKPMFGINVGRLGFMTELERNEVHLIHKMFEQPCAIDCRMMLEVQVLRAGLPMYQATALNDVVINKRNPFRAIRVDVKADDVSVMSFQGDGLIVATPTGTTAYCHSSGGPIVEPTAENIAVTPIAPFALGVSSIVFAPNRTIAVRAQGSDGERACIAADSEGAFDLMPEDCVHIKRAQCVVQLLKIKDQSFYQILKQKYTDGGDKP